MSISEQEPIIYIDHSEVREGKLQELKKAITELAKFVEANEPRIIAYNVYFTQDGNRMNVVHVHPDSTSLEFHMKVAGPAFSKFVDCVKLLEIDIYGKPGDDLLEQLRKKARMLGGGNVVVHGFHEGFVRFGTR